jgi:hypothetical protein
MKITKLEDMYPYTYIIRKLGRTYLWTADGKLITWKKYKELQNGE